MHFFFGGGEAIAPLTPPPLFRRPCLALDIHVFCLRAELAESAKRFEECTQN